MTLKKIYLPEQCYFITTNVINKEWIFGKLMKNDIYVLNDKICCIVVDVLNFTRKKFKYLLNGYVIMLDHLHMILTTAGDKSPAMRTSENNGHTHCVGGDSSIDKQALGNNNHVPRVGGDLSPPSEYNISHVMHAIKGRSARLINKELGKSGQFWQHDFYEHGIRNERDFEEKLNYIHLNPVRTDLVKNPEDYPYSSYRNYYLNDHSIIKIDIINI